MLVLQPYEVVLWGAGRDRPLHRLTVQAFSEDEAKEAALAQYRIGFPWQQPAKVERVEVLSGIHLNPKKRQQSLFEDLADLCATSDAKLEDIQGACVNLLLVSVQKRYLTLGEAERRWDELMGRGRQALKDRMDPVELGMKLIQ